MRPENIEKKLYLRRNRGKIRLLRCPRNPDNFFLYNYNTMMPKNIGGQNVVKVWPRQNHTTKIPKKTDNL